ncbi:TPM domain-containing protein [Cytophagaceae bacterium ABcell3]|nr:TPM domain-containing protein [Cytophagaceae bacterium ABcell3]
MKHIKNITLLSLLLLSVVVCLADNSRFPKPENPPRLVNDYAKLLQPGEREVLEKKLRTYHDSTSTQIAVVIMNDLGGEPASSFAPALGEYWKVGQKGKNNGLLILVSKESREVFIATGYGMEATITDARSKNIVENIIKPAFKKNKYYEGIDQATTAIIQYAFGEHYAERGSKDKATNNSNNTLLIVIILVVIILVLKSKGGNNGRGRNTGPTTFSRRGAYMGPVIGGGAFGGGGFNGGGFGTSGGGFGGFGGGSFGGGGAGGKW